MCWIYEAATTVMWRHRATGEWAGWTELAYVFTDDGGKINGPGYYYFIYILVFQTVNEFSVTALLNKKGLSFSFFSTFLTIWYNSTICFMCK